jgi:hypothetical protein
MLSEKVGNLVGSIRNNFSLYEKLPRRFISAKSGLIHFLVDVLVLEGATLQNLNWWLHMVVVRYILLDPLRPCSFTSDCTRNHSG